MNQAVFLDRDGTLIEDRHYLRDPDEVVLFPGTADALQKLTAKGFQLFIVSNQSGVGRGLLTMADVAATNARLTELLAPHGVEFLKIYIAPEAPDQPSRGRKPSPQYLFDARDEFGVDLGRSYMVGDKLIDLECGWAAGVRRSLLVRTGYGRKVEQEFPEKLEQAIVLDDLAASAAWIIGEESVQETRSTGTS